ncbi:MAG: hypothetical protein CSA65_09230 [Proteobacteria bacterium]|nr:MAG: hypothetical protein CSB49_08140 [Pseudomonadota bacterium]PIE17357.1 MAG: hypothetical protein CSA65_09230 [Pseudomonadota bacterium]
MDSNTANLEIALYACAGLAMAIALYRTIFTIRNTGNIKMLTPQLVKLVAADNIKRAHKLCAVTPNSLFLRMVRPALSAAMNAKGKSRDARATCAEQAFAMAYDNVLRASDRLGPLLSIVALGFALLPLLFGAVALGGLPPTPLIVLCVLSVGIALWSYSSSQALRAEAKPAFARVVAAIRKG